MKIVRRGRHRPALILAVLVPACSDVAGIEENLAAQELDSRVVGTGQEQCYDAQAPVPCPSYGDSFFGHNLFACALMSVEREPRAVIVFVPPHFAVQANRFR